MYRLWLDSEDYETWARRELSSVTSRVNQLGFQLQTEINPRRKCYYWLFQDKTDEAYRPLTQCPACEKNLTEHHGEGFTQLVCEDCGILMPG
ncbi:MAG TPA: hypothetical protein ENL03_01310 [Phycisphaerae bacterium]|nr:hypothetical protein [Phycisphaerae bacterium]